MRYFSTEDDADKKDKDSDKKVPQGFEKFLRKTRKPPTATEPAGKNGDVEGQEKKEDSSKKDTKKMKRDEDDEELSEEEEEPKKEEKKQSESGTKKQLNEFFMQPNGKGPKWENVGLVAALAGAFTYYLATREASSEEITYMDFVNSFLS
jgi:AFG3 family protein